MDSSLNDPLSHTDGNSSSSSSSYCPSVDDSPPPNVSANNKSGSSDSENIIDQQVPSNGQNVLPRARKPYTSDVRPKRQQSTKPSRRQLWLDELTSMTKPKFHASRCCKHLKCYRHANFDFYVKKAREIITADRTTRRTILRSFMDSDKKFRFNGRVVCVLFMRKAFHFSSVFISETANGKPRTHTSSSSPSSSQQISATSVNSQAGSSQSNSSDSSVETQVKKRDAVISFIQRTAEDCGDSMPDKIEIHLPFYNYNEIFPVFAAGQSGSL